MTLWTTSAGIINKQCLIEACLHNKLSQIKVLNQFNRDDIVVGWGLKENSNKAKNLAKKNNLQYLHLEDGFIGYVGHPASNGHAISLISDSIGVYYDARSPSLLEAQIVQVKGKNELERARDLIESIKANGITKYNCYNRVELPARLAALFTLDKKSKVLVVDQVAGDLSINGALANQQSFIDMIEQAKENHPDSTIYLRTHPDTRLGNKSGVLANLNIDNVVVIGDACHPHELIEAVDYVYTVSSQMGFEALMLGKPVHCFGMPFYAGWGLTQDSQKCSRRGKASLLDVVAAALIEYPKYYDPISRQAITVEQAIEIIVRQYKQPPQWQCLYLVGFSLWKKAFMFDFCQHLADKIKFVTQPPKFLSDSDNIVVWGAQYPELTKCIRVEDGFIRSNGLGSNFCRPSSLSIDPLGIYFNSQKESQLEHSLNNKMLNGQELNRGKQLITFLQHNGVSKYNVGNLSKYTPPNDNKQLVLVVGQVDGDASIKNGSAQITSNENLLWAVRRENPRVHIIFKPHPDVVAGNRAGKISESCMKHCVDSQVLNLDLNSLYPHVSELHTMTSLSGFEALIQNVKVVTWGQPFYSGWGLTHDMNPPQRRNRVVSLSELVYCTLVDYPSYIDWDTGLCSSPEQLIAQVEKYDRKEATPESKLKRWSVKLTYLLQTLTMRYTNGLTRGQ